MKWISKLLAAIILCGISMPAFSAMSLGGTYESTDSYCFIDMIIEETGILKGTRSEFLKVTIKGSAELDQCFMKKEVVSYGTLVANKTEFSTDLSIFAGNTTLSSCNLTNLYISDNDEEKSKNPIHVILDGSTVVNGDIVFETGLGRVYKGPNVLILGEIKGGTLIELQN